MEFRGHAKLLNNFDCGLCGVCEWYGCKELGKWEGENIVWVGLDYDFFL